MALPITSRTRGVVFSALLSLLCYLSGLLAIVTPLPLLYVYSVYGRRAGSASSALAAAALAGLYFFVLPLLSGGKSAAMLPGGAMVQQIGMWWVLWIALGHYLFFIMIGVMLGEGAWRRWELKRWIGTAVAVALGYALLVLVAVQWFGQLQVLHEIRVLLDSTVAEVVSMAPTTGGAQVEWLKQHRADVVRTAYEILPSMAFVYALLVTTVTALLGRRLIRSRHGAGYIHNVASFRLPDAAVWLLIAAVAVNLVNATVFPHAWLRVLGMNLGLAMAALYFLQGLAVMAYMLQRLHAPLLRLVSYLMLILFFQVMALMLVTVGVADVWMEFRSRGKASPRRPITTDDVE